MPSTKDLFQVLDLVGSRAQNHVSSPPDCPKRASVAVVIAFFPTNAASCNAAGAVTGTRYATRAELEAGVKESDNVPHILFIRRAKRESDRWSSHIALPGGRREREESDLEASIRETREEVDLDVSPLHADLIGSLGQRMVTSQLGNKTLLVLCPFLFLYRTAGVVPFTTAQVDEVSATHWVPLHALLDPRNQTIESVDVSARLLSRSSSLLQRCVGASIGVMEFDGIQLRPSTSTYESSQIPLSCQRDERRVMWGLTHAVLLDLLSLFSQSDIRQRWKFPTFSAIDVRFVLWCMNLRNRTVTKRYRGTDYVGHALLGYYRLIRPAIAITLLARLVFFITALKFIYRRIRGVR